MRIKLPLYATGLFFLTTALCQAQELDEKILMSVGNSRVQAGEFIRMYRKTPLSEEKSAFDEYLEQYIIFRLKVEDALAEGLDTTLAFRKELEGYRTQLAQSFLTDSETRERLLSKAYERYLTDINAWHILIGCPPDASPSDTLKAWKKSLNIRERILSGELFEHVARSTSEDQSVLINGGNLGYFTVFQMIMPFEDAAYALKPESISMPVRTSYGYHIIKVTDRRPSKGKIRVAHIMKAAPPGISDEEERKAEQDINDLYKRLQEGAPFSVLAKEYSDHKESSVRGGEMNWFGTGEIISDFSEAAFALNDTGTYSKPVRTLYGWHIIKLLEKRAPGSLEETRSFLESKINQSYLSSVSKRTFIGRLRKEYNFSLNHDAYRWLVNNTDSLKIKGLVRYPSEQIPAGNIYSFADQYLTVREFVNSLETRSSMIKTSIPSVFIDKSLETISDDHIIKYENSRLEKKYPEFRYLMKEFHDGMLLFEISEKEIWNRAQEDSAGLKDYYEANKHMYMASRSIDAIIYTLRQKGSDKQFRTLLRRVSRRQDAEKRLNERYNKGGDTLLYVTNGRWYRGDEPDLDNLRWTKGLHFFQTNGYPSAIVISKVTDPAPMPLNEIKGELMAGYQNDLELTWIRQLKEKYPVKIDDAVLKEVRKGLENE
jgi:peptidyl-prolyl cis-trans isomerase SurA